MRGKSVVLIVAVVLSAAATGAAAAGSSTPTYKACASKQGVLSLQLKGKCAKGTSKVSLGATGPRGAQGPAGMQGIQGIQGVPGNPASYPTTLPSGRTEVGTYSLNADGTGGQPYPSANISFPIPLAAGLDAAHTVIGDTDHTHCPGTAAAPAALPGYLCIYQTGGTEFGDLELDIQDGPTTSSLGSLPFGAFLSYPSSSAGTIVVYGTWAVTAP